MPQVLRFAASLLLLAGLGSTPATGADPTGSGEIARDPAGAADALADALEGPWRWLDTAPGRLESGGRLLNGPWREPSISLDQPRRTALLDQLPPAPPRGVEHADGSVLQREAALESARLLEAARAWQGAAEAYESVLAWTERPRVGIWHGLAISRTRAGDSLAAERAFLQGLEASGPADDQVRLRFDLAAFYAGHGRWLEALAVLDALAPHVRGSTVLESARRALSASIELAALTQSRGIGPVWPERERDLAWKTFPAGVRSAVGWLPAGMRDRLLPLAERLRSEDRALRPVAAMGAIGLVIAVLFVLLRQRGDVAVALEYPEELRGIFRVRIRGGSRLPTNDATDEKIRRGGASTRREHHLVSRETQFQRLFTGRYRVIVDGLLVDPVSDEVLARIHDEKMVRIRHRRTVRIEFDVHPSSCPVDVRVKWGERPAHEAQITVPGFIDKPRSTQGGEIRIFLPKGDHRLLLGCGDRVFDRPLRVASFRPNPVLLDVLEEEPVFKGCPPGVAPYLMGDLSGVARALERDGQAPVGFRLLARMYQEKGDAARAADYFESAGDLVAAARLRLAHDHPGRAAVLFEQAEMWLDAAEAYRLDGVLVNAGECYERALDYDRAIDCYRECGAIDRWLTALERCGQVFEAAKLALDKQQRPRAIRLLQRVEPTDPDFAQACAMLAEAFETEGHFDLAAGKLDEYIATFRPAHATAETYSRLAELWEQAGHLERALDVLEDLRRREPTFPNIAARIEVLRKHRSATGYLFSSGSRPKDGATTAFVGDRRYELLEEIGWGGMGVVYRALDTRLDRVVALKRLPEDLRRHHPRALQLFLREAQSAARLNHPNIVTVYDADQQEGQFFITMELLEGQPLHTVLRERGQLSPSNLLGIARQACRGLDYAHGQGVIHRDIKTANLFVTTERVVKIMDFGLAKVIEEVRGGTTLVSGTPYYMSPEQVIGGDLDQRTDLYSLGVTMFELATGRVPFDSGEVAYHHRHSPVPDPLSLRPDLPDELARLILRLLEKDPDLRPSSAAEVLEALTRIEPEI